MNKPPRPPQSRGLVPANKQPVVQQIRAKPIAPPVYRPQPTPKVLQRKVAQPPSPIVAQRTPAPPSNAPLPPKHFQPVSTVPKHRPMQGMPPIKGGQSRQVLQRKLKANDKDANVPIAQTVADTDTAEYTKTRGDKDINITDRALRKRVSILVDQNSGSSRYISTASVNLNSTNVKNADKKTVTWDPGAEYQPVAITCEYDLVGAAHGTTPTPHVRIGIKPKNQGFIYLFGNRVVALSDHEVTLILNNAAEDYLLPWVKTSVEKALANRSFGKTITSPEYAIK